MTPTEQRNNKLEAESEQRMEQVTRLYLGGKTMREVGRVLGISVMAVVRDLQRARQAWKEKAALAYGDALPVAIARCEFIYEQACEGWYRSLEHEKREDSESSTGPKGPTKRRRKSRKSQSGNPMFLARMEAALRLDCQLRGMLDKDAGNAAEETTEVVEVVIATREENEEFKTLSLEAFKQRRTEAAEKVG